MANLGDGVGVTQRVQKVTLAKWVKRMHDLTKRKLVVFAMLEKKGLITSGCSGGQVRWPVEIAEHALNPFVNNQMVTFQPFTAEENAFLPWRGYYLKDFITRQEKLENKGTEAIINLFDGKMKKIQRNAMRRLAYEIYKDGNSVAGVAANRFHGLESFMGINTGAQVASDDLATTHADTYANLSTARGALNAEFTDCWTPVIVSTNRNPGSGALAWVDYADEYCRKLIIEMTKGQAEDENCGLITLTKDAYEDLLNILDGKERIAIERGKQTALASMGFKNVELDGVPITWDVAVPSTDDNGDTVHGYGLTPDQMELLLLGPGGIFKSDMTFSTSFQGDEFFVWTLGNMRVESPRYFGKLAAIA